MQNFIKTFAGIGINDIESVGGKNASLGEMFNKLLSTENIYEEEQALEWLLKYALVRSENKN